MSYATDPYHDDPVELFFFVQACGTSRSGYLQRKLQKTLESLQRRYDMTIRNSQQNIICWRLLDDINPRYMELWEAHDLLVPCDDPAVELLRAPLASIRRSQTMRVDKTLVIPFNLERYLARFYLRHGARVGLEHTPTTVPEPRADAPVQTHEHVFHGWLADRLRALPATDPVPVAVMDECAARLFTIYTGVCMDLQLYHVLVTVRDCRDVLTPPIFATAMLAMAYKIRRCKLHAGTAVGSIAASSIAEPCTQGCLDSFHSTGEELKQETGVQRMRHLVEQSASASCCVHVCPKHRAVATDRRLMQHIADSMLPLSLQDVMARVELTAQMPAGTRFAARDAPVTAVKHAVVYLDVDKLKAKRLTSLDVLKHLKTQLTVPVTVSSFRLAEPFVAVHFTKAFDNERSLLAAKQAVPKLLVRGFEEVAHASVKRRFGDDVGDDPVYDLYFRTKNGSLAPFFLSDESLFDLATLRCNNVVVAYETWGIESALHTLFSELKTVICDDGHTNNHHIYILACAICFPGRMVATTRHGMRKGPISDVIERATFEEPKLVFVHAATFSDESVNIRNCPSSATVTGSVAGVGTGVIDVYPDPQLFQKPPPLPKIPVRGCAAPPATTTTTTATATAQPRATTASPEPPERPELQQWWDCSRPPAYYLHALRSTAARVLEARRSRAPAPKKRVRIGIDYQGLEAMDRATAPSAGSGSESAADGGDGEDGDDEAGTCDEEPTDDEQDYVNAVAAVPTAAHLQYLSDEFAAPTDFFLP